MTTGPRITRRRLTVIAAAGVLLAAGAPGTAGAKATSSRGLQKTLITNTINLVSSTGHHLSLEIEVDRTRFRDDPSMDTDIYLFVFSHSGESHTWEIDEVPAAAFHAEPKGNGSVTLTSRQFGGYGRLALTFVATGRLRTTTCAPTTSVTHRPVRLVGRAVLHTHSAWGSLGTAHHPLRFRKSDLELTKGAQDAGCTPGGPDPSYCHGGFDWSSPGSARGGIDGDTGSGTSSIDYFTFHTLDPDHNVQLGTDDFAAIPTPTLTTDDSGGKRLTISAGSHGLFTGSATLTTEGSPKPNKDGCPYSGEIWSAAWTQGTNPLTVHNVIGGDFTPRNSSEGGYFEQNGSAGAARG